MDNTAKNRAGKVVPIQRPGDKLPFLNLRDIMEREYTDPLFVVEELLPSDAAMLLTAKPKSGKTWMAMQAALSVATGKPLFGRYRVIRPGRVLYYALEETPRRVKNRMKALLPDNDVKGLENIEFLFDAPEKLGEGEGGEMRLSSYLRDHPGVSLIVLDTLLACFPSSARRDVVRVDYERSQILRRLATENHVSLLCVAHQRKGSDDSPQDAVNGTTGILAGVDGLLSLENKNGGTLMHIRSRETGDKTLAMRFDIDCGIGWSVIGDGVDSTTQQRAQLISALEEFGPSTPTELARKTGKKVDAIKQLLRRMLDKEQVTRQTEGRDAKYAAVPRFGRRPGEPFEPHDIPI